jgi:nitrate reductase gamma subunit
MIVTPLFLGTHIILWERDLGVGWPAISNGLADYLTLIAIAAGILLFVERVGSKSSRRLSRPNDYLWPLLITVPFISGYLAMHPHLNPFVYSATMFVHVMSANLIFVLIPFTKLSHVALFPTTQLISELGWYLEPESGRRVMLARNKEKKPI